MFPETFPEIPQRYKLTQLGKLSTTTRYNKATVDVRLFMLAFLYLGRAAWKYSFNQTYKRCPTIIIAFISMT